MAELLNLDDKRPCLLCHGGTSPPLSDSNNRFLEKRIADGNLNEAMDIARIAWDQFPRLQESADSKRMMEFVMEGLQEKINMQVLVPIGNSTTAMTAILNRLEGLVEKNPSLIEAGFNRTLEGFKAEITDIRVAIHEPAAKINQLNELVSQLVYRPIAKGNFLDANGIPCIAYSGTSVFERPVVELAMDCIGYVFSCRGYKTEDVPELANLKLQYSQIFSRLQNPAADADFFASKLTTVRKQAAVIHAKSPKDYFGDLGLQGFYYKILNAMGAENFDFGDVFNYSLAALSAAISDYESVWIRLRASEVKGFFFYVYAFARGHYAETEHSDATIIDAVHVLTIHKAKGLEFPVVFLPNFEKKRKRLPTGTLVDSNLYDLRKYGGDEEDERRVYYTAITRSEKYLYITGSESQENRKQTNYVPHPFLDEIDKRYFSDHLTVHRAHSGYPPKTRSTGAFPTSFSHLICYDRCPHDFRLRHVYSFNAGVPVTFGYGTNIHNALNMIHNGYIRAKKIPSEQEIEKAFDRIFKLRYATDKIAQNMKKSAIKVVKNYVRLHASEFGRILETEKQFEFVLDDALVSGQIDLLKKVDESGKVTEVEIIDFKTDRNDSIYSGDYERQLRFYAIACLESLGLRPEKAYVHHLDGDSSTFVDISHAKLEETKHETRKQITAVLAHEFPPKPSDATCKECDYKAICPHKHFRVGITD